MIYRLTLIIAFIFSITIINAQIAGTTLEEYRFLSKGYAYQVEMGLDTEKDGYHIQDLYTSGDNIRVVGMFRAGEPGACALLIIFPPTEKQKEKFLCIPNGRTAPEILKMHEQDKSSIMTYDNKKYFDRAMQGLVFRLLENPNAAPVAFSHPDRQRKSGAASYEPVTSSETDIPETYEKSIAIRSSLSSGKEEGKRTDLDSRVAVNHFLSDGLSDRTVVNKPELIKIYPKRGTVVVKVIVNEMGKVTSAKFTQRGSDTFDPDLKEEAVQTALEYEFSAGQLKEDNGMITFEFK